MDIYKARLVAFWLAAGVACEAVALAAPQRGAAADTAYLLPIMLGVAVAASVFGATVALIAWRSREWAPSLLALGCVSMAIGGVSRFAFADGGLGLAPGQAGALPLVGMLLGGFWFFLCVQPWWPARSGRPSRVRPVMLAGVAIAVAGSLAVVAFPAVVPNATVLRLLAGVAATGYVVAALRIVAVWRFLRLPSQLSMFAGSFLFAPAVIARSRPVVCPAYARGSSN